MDGADGVYPSSEDSFLLMDALEQDVEVYKADDRERAVLH